AAAALPEGTVIDGEVLAWSHEREAPLGFASLQRRLNRKTPAARLQAQIPVVLLAYDLLEIERRDLRSAPLHERRELLETLLPRLPTLRLSPVIDAPTWEALAHMRERSREV